MSTKAERDRLVEELSDLSTRIFKAGGGGFLAACAGALAEGAAAAIPADGLMQLCQELLDAVACGASRNGGVSMRVFVRDADEQPAGGGLH